MFTSTLNHTTIFQDNSFKTKTRNNVMYLVMSDIMLVSYACGIFHYIKIMASTFSRIMAMKIANKFFENFMYQINFHVVYFLEDEELLLLSKCEHSFAAWFHTILNSNSYESFYDDKNKFFLQTTIYIFFPPPHSSFE